ncbi:PASTA domain-containing protein [Agromyces sp. NPDC058064]|uniref:PASTA domain-containing protein n=1 Tax=Agromyces sp. NPDC058064 TaxID=3346322 RepID=UPI0036D7B7A6
MRRLLGSVMLAALALTGCTASPKPSAPPTPSTSTDAAIVPDVVGMGGLEAAQALSQAGLAAAPRWKSTATTNSDLFEVQEQDPAPGTESPRGTEVTLMVGSPPLPEYEVEQAGDLFEVTVAATITARDAHWIVRDIADATDADGGYFVSINCSMGGTDLVDNRQANGKFAVGKRGAALTGLAVGASESEIVEGATCP